MIHVDLHLTSNGQGGCDRTPERERNHAGLGGDAIVCALERDFDLLVLDGTGALGGEWPELRAAPDLALGGADRRSLRA